MQPVMIHDPQHTLTALRMLIYCLSGARPIPKTVWLACVGWQAHHSPTASPQRTQPPV